MRRQPPQLIAGPGPELRWHWGERGYGRQDSACCYPREVGGFTVPHAVASMAVPVGKIHMLSYRISDKGGGVT